MSPIISPSGGGSGGGSQTFGVGEATLTSAQIKALDPTHLVTLASAPGAGKAYMPLGVMTQFIAGVHSYGATPIARLEVGAFDQVAQDYSTWETHQGHDALVVLNPPGDAVAWWTRNASPMDLTRFPANVVENLPLVIGCPGGSFNVGTILSASLGAAGSGYAPGDQFVIGNGTSYESGYGEVDTVDGGGAVLTFHILDPGAAGIVAYIAGTTYPTTKVGGGGGDDLLTVIVSTIQAGDGQLTVRVPYAIVNVV